MRYLIGFIFFCSLNLQAATLDPVEEALGQAIDAQQAQAIALLENLVNTNSGSLNFTGVRQVADMIAEELTALGFTTQWLDLQAETNRAGHLIATKPLQPEQPHLLLMGHLDTVFPADSDFQQFTRDGNTLRGPGVTDMKGGIVVMLTALQALQQTNQLADMNITIVLTGDEESAGAPADVARQALIEAAIQADYALSFEFARDLTSIVNARRGYTRWTLKVQGEAGHSAAIFSSAKNSSAIYEAARLLNDFNQCFKDIHGLTLNPGLIVGGGEAELTHANTAGQAQGKRNVIAAEVLVHGDMRYLTNEQRDETKEKMLTLLAKNPGTAKARIEFIDSKPAFSASAESENLLNFLNQINLDLGLPAMAAVDPIRAGAGDINYISRFVAGIDGLGPIGNGLHSTEETMDLESFPVITQRTAILMYRLAKH